MASVFKVALPAAVNEYFRLQRAREAEAEKVRQFEETKKLDRERLAILREQYQSQYEPVKMRMPLELGGGELEGPRAALPALIQALAARERELGPEEIGAFGMLRERIVNPEAMKTAEAEAQATEKAFPQFRTWPLTVDMPQDIRLPRQAVEKVIGEASQEAKERRQEERTAKERRVDARYRQLYDAALAADFPHSVAQSGAIQQAEKEFGISPSREAFVPTPTERKPTIHFDAFVDEKGNRVITVIDMTGRTLLSKSLGKARTQEETFQTGKFLAQLQLRIQGLPTQDPAVGAMTKQQAETIFSNLSKADFLSRLLPGLEIGAGAAPIQQPASTPPLSAPSARPPRVPVPSPAAIGIPTKAEKIAEFSNMPPASEYPHTWANENGKWSYSDGRKWYSVSEYGEKPEGVD